MTTIENLDVLARFVHRDAPVDERDRHIWSEIGEMRRNLYRSIAIAEQSCGEDRRDGAIGWVPLYLQCFARDLGKAKDRARLVVQMAHGLHLKGPEADALLTCPSDDREREARALGKDLLACFGSTGPDRRRCVARHLEVMLNMLLLDAEPRLGTSVLFAVPPLPLDLDGEPLAVAAA